MRNGLVEEASLQYEPGRRMHLFQIETYIPKGGATKRGRNTADEDCAFRNNSNRQKSAISGLIYAKI